MSQHLKRFVVVSLLLTAPLANAYIGPGAGLSAIGSLLALIGAFLLMILGFLWYPIKRFRNRRKAAKAEAEAGAGEDARRSGASRPAEERSTEMQPRDKAADTHGR